MALFIRIGLIALICLSLILDRSEAKRRLTCSFKPQWIRSAW